MNAPGQQLVHLVLTLVKAGDLETLPTLIKGQQLELAQELGELIKNYNYVHSLAFESMVKGKSIVAADALRRKYSEPSKRVELKRQFYDHMQRFLTVGDVASHFPSSATERVSELRRKLNEIVTT